MYLSFVRLRIRGRRAAVVAAAGVVAIAAAGCSSFVSQPTAGQIAPNGDVAVNTAVCLDGFDSNGGPPGTGGYGTDCQTPGPLASSGADVSSGYGQALIGYELPVGAGAPSTLSSPDLPNVTFTQNADYTTYLNGYSTTQPAAGYSWVGYMSTPFTITQSTEIDLTTDFSTPPTNGSPYAGPFVVQVAIGDRADDDTDPGSPIPSSRPLNCNGAGVGVNDTGCLDDLSESPLNVATRELTSVAPASAITVQAGATATVPFTIEYAGPSAEPFQLSASTSSDALIATPAAATYTPTGTGHTTADVTVPIPAGLTPGTYTVTLNVGSFGSTQATLNVTAAPAPPTTTTTATVAPAVTPAVRPAISGFDVTRSLKLTLRLNIAATARLTLQRGRGHRWITLKKLSTRGSAGLNTLHLRGLFGKLLTPAGRYRVSVQAIEGTASSAAQSLTFTVR